VANRQGWHQDRGFLVDPIASRKGGATASLDADLLSFRRGECRPPAATRFRRGPAHAARRQHGDVVLNIAGRARIGLEGHGLRCLPRGRANVVRHLVRRGSNREAPPARPAGVVNKAPKPVSGEGRGLDVATGGGLGGSSDRGLYERRSQPPHQAGGCGSHCHFRGPAQALHALRAVGSLNHPRVTLSRGSSARNR
jgi:hypothetical protein